MPHMPFKWKVSEILEEHKITPYRLAKDSGLANNTVYSIVNGKSEVMHGQVLEKLLSTLEDLTGKKFLIQDVVEWTRAPNKSTKK
jgi:predicted transcriptional regulator